MSSGVNSSAYPTQLRSGSASVSLAKPERVAESRSTIAIARRGSALGLDLVEQHGGAENAAGHDCQSEPGKAQAAQQHRAAPQRRGVKPPGQPTHQRERDERRYRQRAADCHPAERGRGPVADRRAGADRDHDAGGCKNYEQQSGRRHQQDAQPAPCDRQPVESSGSAGPGQRADQQKPRPERRLQHDQHHRAARWPVLPADHGAVISTSETNQACSSAAAASTMSSSTTMISPPRLCSLI